MPNSHMRSRNICHDFPNRHRLDERRGTPAVRDVNQLRPRNRRQECEDHDQESRSDGDLQAVKPWTVPREEAPAPGVARAGRFLSSVNGAAQKIGHAAMVRCAGAAAGIASGNICTSSDHIFECVDIPRVLWCLLEATTPGRASRESPPFS